MSRNGNQIIHLRILFSVRNPAYVRYYDSVLRALVAQGHTVELVTQAGKRPWPPSVVALADECPRIRLSVLPDVTFDPWWELASRLRQARFYLRFLRPEYEQTPELLARARTRAPKMAVRLGEWVGRGTTARRLLVRVIDVLEQSTRGAALFREYLREQRPDVLVTTPLVVLKTAQLDLARAAIELGIRNIFAVASWDHLSSKGELNFVPQHVFVWNAIQKREAQNLHHIAPARVIATGAPVFDDWFNRTPSTTREAVLRARRPAPGSAHHLVRMFRSPGRQPARGAIRATLGAPSPPERRSRAARLRDPDPAAFPARARMAGD